MLVYVISSFCFLWSAKTHSKLKQTAKPKSSRTLIGQLPSPTHFLGVGEINSSYFAGLL
ncbi:hypothetical protein GBAR_LOCUS29228 [Geodia barretti]|uniref:Uncharacterized protein n=1 Tax=Geodia barretti TaxID=519541 RepID=A0AA35TSM8_GEOBA|nr:hypothetical protein GBAR_LOCUS29228 [Geodia barretti]